MPDPSAASAVALGVHSLASYGIAWLLTDSDAFAWLRALAVRVRLIDALLSCTVCTSVWVAAALAAAARWARLPLASVANAADMAVLTGVVVAVSLAIDRAGSRDG